MYPTSPCFSNTTFTFMSPCSCTCCSCCLDAVPFFFCLGYYLDSAPISADLWDWGGGELILTSQSSIRPHCILFVSYTDYKTNSVFIYWHDYQAILLFIFSSTVSGNKSSSLNFILKKSRNEQINEFSQPLRPHISNSGLTFPCMLSSGASSCLVVNCIDNSLFSFTFTSTQL